jgi:hypothetical protein
MSEITVKSYQFKVLHEEAQEVDSFPDSTHEGVASQIHNIINHSSKGLTIGVEGAWGSGKSTVVNILKNKLKKDDDETLVFAFDAWAHEGDPLRRIFLESLIECIDPQREDKALEDIKGNVSGRKKTVTVTTNRKASNLGRNIGISTLLVPMGAALLSAIDYDKLHAPWSEMAGSSPQLTFIFGLIFSLAPVIPIVHWRFCGDKCKTDEKKKDWSFFESSSTEDYTQDITEDSERSSIEFEHFFNQIMNHSIGKGKKYQRILIVIDNLDRVDSETALSIWSALQTYFQHRSGLNNSNLNDSLWFLVPYDRESLVKAWEVPTSTESGSQDEEKSISNRGLSFIEKNFQVITEVPKPIMSGWVHYLNSAVEESLESWPTNNKAEIIEAFNRYECDISKSPTPRRIRRFVNQVGVLGVRWGNTFSSESLALYSLIKLDYTESELREVLLSSQIPNNYQSASKKNDLLSELSGIMFGVEKEKGVQLLLEPVIREALHNGDEISLQKLEETHKHAFWVVWNSFESGSPYSLSEKHSDDYRINYTTAFLKAFGLEKTPKITLETLERVWKDVNIKWDFESYDFSESIKLLSNLTNSEELRDRLLIVFKEHLRESINTFEKDEFDENKILNMDKFHEMLRDIDVGVTKLHYPALDSSKWFSWISYCDKNEIDLPCVLPTKDAIKNVASQITMHQAPDTLINQLIGSLSYPALHKEYEAVASNLYLWLMNQGRQNPHQDNVYKILLNMIQKGITGVKERLKEIFEHPHFFNISNTNNFNSVPTLFVLYPVVFNGDIFDKKGMTEIQNFWKKGQDSEVTKSLFYKFVLSNQVETIWELALNEQCEAVRNIINEYIDNDSLIRSKELPACIEEYIVSDSPFYSVIVPKLVNKGELNRIEPTILEGVYSYRHTSDVYRKYGGPEGIAHAQKIYDQATSEDWKKEFQTDLVLINFSDSRGSHNYKDGFTEAMRSIINGEESGENLVSNFDYIVEKLLDKEEVFDYLLDEYFKCKDDNFTDSIFNSINKYFSEKIDSLEGEIIRMRIEHWLTNDQFGRVKWLVENTPELRIEPNESIESRIRELIKVSSEEKKILVDSLAALFSIQVDNEEEVSNEIEST